MWIVAGRRGSGAAKSSESMYWAMVRGHEPLPSDETGRDALLKKWVVLTGLPATAV